MKIIRIFVPDFSVYSMNNNDEYIAYKDMYWGNELVVEVPETNCYWSDIFSHYVVWSYDWKIISE